MREWIENISFSEYCCQCTYGKSKFIGTGMRIELLRMILNQRALIQRMGAINLQRRNRACNGPCSGSGGSDCAWGVAPPTVLLGAYGRISFLFMSVCEQYSPPGPFCIPRKCYGQIKRTHIIVFTTAVNYSSTNRCDQYFIRRPVLRPYSVSREVQAIQAIHHLITLFIPDRDV